MKTIPSTTITGGSGAIGDAAYHASIGLWGAFEASGLRVEDDWTDIIGVWIAGGPLDATEDIPAGSSWGNCYGASYGNYATR